MATADLATLPGFFRVTATESDGMGRKRSLQAERRKPMIWTDQHGREWAASAEMPDLEPCTPLVPNGWRAPILPPPQFIKPVHRGGRVTNERAIDYVAWRLHQGELQARHEEERRYHASRMFPNSWARELQDNNPLIAQEAGPAPYAVDFVVAAELGNKWVLGLSDRKPSWVTPALEATIPRPQRYGPAMATRTAYPDAEDEDLIDAALDDPTFGGALEDLTDTPARSRKRAS